MDITKDKITPQWLAGLFDGEGSVCASIHGCSYNVIVNITQCNIALMGILMSMFPYGTIMAKKPDAKVNRTLCFSLQWRGTSAKQFLDYIKDYVVLKQGRVLLALDLIDLLLRKGAVVPQDNKDKREEIALKIKKANEEQSEQNITVQ